MNGRRPAVAGQGKVVCEATHRPAVLQRPLDWRCLQRAPATAVLLASLNASRTALLIPVDDCLPSGVAAGDTLPVHTLPVLPR
jgi:hypothetical protein